MDTPEGVRWDNRQMSCSADDDDDDDKDYDKESIEINLPFSLMKCPT
jgi:hypothetical protein